MKKILIGGLLIAATMLFGFASLYAQGSGNGGGGGTIFINPLPQTPPAPDVIMRDSFGQGPEFLRPASGKGTLKSTASGGTSISGFWLEYLGTKDYRWTTIDSGVTWRFCSTDVNPYELFSPLQVVYGTYQNTILCTQLNVGPVAPPLSPTALIPMPSNLSVPYEIEINGTYHPIPGAYLALGLTNSGATNGNLAAVGNIILVLKPHPDNSGYVVCELRLGGLNGQLLASTTGEDSYFNQLKIRYSPQTRMIGANYNGVDLGNFQTNITPSRYAAIEGIGNADNFVIRRAQ